MATLTASLKEETRAAAPEPRLVPSPIDQGNPLGIGSPSREEWAKLRRRMVAHLSAGLETDLKLGPTAANLEQLSRRFSDVCVQAGIPSSAENRDRLQQEVIDEILGYGPIEPLLRDDSISEIMVNAPDQVYVERDGKLLAAEVQFDDDEHIMFVIDRIIRPLGRRVDRSNPMVDARLPDGSRLNAIIPPGAIDGPTMTIRKFNKKKLKMADLIAFESLTADMAKFLEACVVARMNIVVSGGTGSGKTTLLNILSSYIPARERVVTVEDSAELQLQQPHVVRLEAQPPDLDGSGEVTIRGLVRNALRMRPDRIVVGEVRGGETIDMLQAMNTGHDGSMTTVHANTPRDSIARLETMTLMAGFELPVTVIRRQIAAAIDLIVQQARVRDGSRKTVNITEIQGMEGDVVILEDVFVFEEGVLGPDGKDTGKLRPTGIRPRCDGRLKRAGYHFPPKMFMGDTSLGDWPGRGRGR